MQLDSSTYQAQSSLAAFCRGGSLPLLPDINENHVLQYKRLIKNIFHDTLSSAYPLTCDMLPSNDWNDLVNQFMLHHACSNPQVWYMPVELYEYVRDNDLPLKKKYLHLLELMQLEWLELEVYMMEDEEQNGVFSDKSDFRKKEICLNTETRIAAFEYPVHLKNARYISHTDKGNYFVSLHRHPESGKVLFVDLKLAHVQLLKHLIDNDSANYTAMLNVFMLHAPQDKAEQALNIFLTDGLFNKLFLLFHT